MWHIFFAYLLVFLIGAFKAISDTLADHFDISVFRNLNRSFWNKTESYTAKRIPFTKYPFNAWHLSNSGMIASALTVPFVYRPYFFWEYAVMGILFILSFNLFYNKILTA